MSSRKKLWRFFLHSPRKTMIMRMLLIEKTTERKTSNVEDSNQSALDDFPIAFEETRQWLWH